MTRSIPGLLRPLARPMGTIGQLAKFNLKKPVQLASATGAKLPFRFDGYQDFSLLGRGYQPQLTAMREIPGILSNQSTGYGYSLAQKGLKLPNNLPDPELWNALASEAPAPAVDPIVRDMRVQHLIKSLRL